MKLKYSELSLNNVDIMNRILNVFVSMYNMWNSIKLSNFFWYSFVHQSSEVQYKLI